MHNLNRHSWYLDQCLQFQIIPATLMVQPPKNIAATQTNIQNEYQNEYQNATSSASMRFILITSNDAKLDG